ncbi:MAG: hypothetical protein ACKOZW_00565 [Cyanobium sp.]
MIGDEELRELESTLLPALERHHLRLLGHALRTLQAVAAGAEALPSRAQLEGWAATQPAIADDPAFREAFVEQLLNAGVQLERIAAWRHGSTAGPTAAPLALALDDLVAWARAQADARLSPPGATTASSPPPA